MSLKIELDITLVCSLKCNNCCRCCGVAPEKLFLSVEDIKRFINESNELNLAFDYVSLLGGEPTLHPDLLEICNLLYNNIKFTGHRDVRIITNGYGQKTIDVLKTVPPYILISNSNKTATSPLFSKYNDAPIDYKEYNNSDFSNGCSTMCGINFHTNKKYYGCAVYSSIDRVFGFDLGANSLADLTAEKIKEQNSTLCKYCGHFKDWNDNRSWTTSQVTSKSWAEALEKYNKINMEKK